MEKIIDSKGIEVKIGDKIKGDGYLYCSGGVKIDLTPIVTVRKVKDKIFFGGLSMQSFRRFYKVENNHKAPFKF